MSKKENSSWKKILSEIKQLYIQYSIFDVASSLFASNLWLPNNSATIQHLLMFSVFASIPVEQFSKESKIKTYGDFKVFLERLYKLTPSFPTLEDFVPNFDWGSVKYPFAGTNYKIFYGAELSHIYDFLTTYEMIYLPYDTEYEHVTGRSPALELKQCLYLQNLIIERITTQPPEEKIKIAKIGDKEIPPKRFWEEIRNTYQDLLSADLSHMSGMDDYTLEFGSLDLKDLDSSNFMNSAFEGKLLPVYFLYDGQYRYPILPRRFSGVLLEKWSTIFTKYEEQVRKEKETTQQSITYEIFNYIRQRFYKQEFFPLVSAVYKDNKPHELMFAGYFISRDRLILILAVSPYTSKEKVEEELNELVSKLTEALELIKNEPVTLALHLERKNVQYESMSDERKLKPEVIVVLPQALPQGIPITMQKEIPAKIVFLDQFVGVMDEIDKTEELCDFLEYLETISKQVNHPILTWIDKWASFKASQGVLIPGANEPNMIMIDPQWGNDERYKSLSAFWKIYPSVDFVEYPRSWKLDKETATRLRLTSRYYRGGAIHTLIGRTNCFFSSPFNKQEFEEGSVSNLLMECLEDYLSKFNSFIEKHKFFQTFEDLTVLIFPNTLIKSEEFKHISHLDPKDNYWIIDKGYPKKGSPGIRIVFNHEKLLEAFRVSEDNGLEIDLLCDVMEHLNDFRPDPSFDEIIKQIQAKKGAPPRYKTLYTQVDAIFPKFVSSEKPNLHDHKLSRKKIAQIALENGIKPGKYNLKKAHEILNKLRNLVIEEINNEVKKYKLELNVQYLLARIDALTYDFEYKRLRLKESLKHDVDYVREADYSKAYGDFVSHHKHYRYLIEKFIQLLPTGNKELESRSFRYLVALIDKLYEIYSASDSLMYEIYPLGISIDRDFLIKVSYSVDLDGMEQAYGEEQAKIEFGFIGKKKDEVTIPAEQYLEKLDAAFKEDFGFKFKNLLNVLQVLSQWPGYVSGEEEAPYYTSTFEQMNEVFTRVIEGYDSKETKLILDFLELKSDGMLTILGDSRRAEDLPVWEHYKRPYRYMLRPLILIGNSYYWGPYSTNRTERIWLNVATTNALPVDLNAPTLKSVLKSSQVDIEKKLEEKSLEIAKRHTQYAERVNYTRGTHTQELGEYDVLAYLPSENVLLNIECKDILGAYCLKDAKRIKEKIFRPEYEDGRKVSNPGNLIKVEKREEYLKNNTSKIKDVLGWPIKENPKIVSLYVTRHDYWWTKFPPRTTSVIFKRIELLDEFIEELKDKK